MCVCVLSLHFYVHAFMHGCVSTCIVWACLFAWLHVWIRGTVAKLSLQSLNSLIIYDVLLVFVQTPFTLTLRLWDIYILEGEKILTAMAYTILKLHKSEKAFSFAYCLLPQSAGRHMIGCSVP